MKIKLIGLSFLMALFVGVGSVQKAEATNAARSAKNTFALNYTTTVSTISQSPCVLYSVVLATGSAVTNEFVVAFDTNTQATAQLTTANFGTGNQRFRVFYSSASVSGPVINFDPPLQFMNGLYVLDSGSGGQSMWVWEPGRGVGAE